MAIRTFAADVDLAQSMVRNYRWVSSHWPNRHRRAQVSYTIHKVLAGIPDERGCFEATLRPNAGEGPAEVDTRQREVGGGREDRFPGKLPAGSGDDSLPDRRLRRSPRL